MQRGGSILVPIDFSNDSRLALQMADYQARAWHSSLILLYVDPRIVSVPMKTNPLLEFARYLKYTPGSRMFCLNCIGDPINTILHVAENFRVRAVFMGYGRPGTKPGHIASGVRAEFDGSVELFSETMAGYISQPI